MCPTARLNPAQDRSWETPQPSPTPRPIRNRKDHPPGAPDPALSLPKGLDFQTWETTNLDPPSPSSQPQCAQD
jgi:hypothetical protein